MMAQTTDELVEQRVAQLQEIRKRRNQLLCEMYILKKRRDDLASVESVDEQDEGLQSFLSEWDLLKQPALAHVSSMLGEYVPPLPIMQPEMPQRSPSPAPHQRSTSTSSATADSPLSHVPEGWEANVGARPQRASSSAAEAEKSAGIPTSTSAEEQRQSLLPRSRIGTSSPALRSTSRIPSESLSDRQERHSRTPSRSSIEPETIVESVQAQQEREISEQRERSDTDVEMHSVERDFSKSVAPVASPQPTTDDVAMSNVSNPPLPLARAEPLYIPNRYVLNGIPPAGPPPPAFMFKQESVEMTIEDQKPDISPAKPDLYRSPTYTLPPLSALPVEFHKKGKSKQSRKRDKEKSEGKSQEWQPMGIAKWGAVIRANPVYKRMARASKCLSSRDWDVAFTELRLLRTIERIDALTKNTGWSFRQPKKHRGVGGLTKTHWDYLMDEMKWMRIDFREERRWKLALAFNLAQAVMEWHAAGTKEERERRGICLNWRKPRPEEVEEDGAGMQVDLEELPVDRDEDTNGESKSNSPPDNEENSDDDSEDEQEREQNACQEAAESRAAIEEALGAIEASEETQHLERDRHHNVLPKVEDIEDRSALHRDEVMDIDKPSNAAVSQKTAADVPKAEGNEATKGLKDLSDNPLLASSSELSTSKQKFKGNAYAPLREQIAYSELDKLILDIDDMGLTQSMSELSTEDQVMALPPPPTDLSSIFPDLQPLGLLDVAPAPEGKKKSDRRGDRDDPNKRAEDTTYQKLTPMSEFIYNRTTLIGVLRPSKHWRDGHWQGLDETTVVADFDTPSARTVDETTLSSLFEGAKPYSPTPNSSLLHPPHLQRELRRRTAYEAAMLDNRSLPNGLPFLLKPKNQDLVWTALDDALLKQLVEKWPSNWSLIAESFNSSRQTITSDRRTPSDCFERWRALLNNNGEDDARPSQTPSTPMTTRGTKRSLSMSMSAANAASAAGGSGEPKKRRRHNVMYETIRKAAKKKEAAQKANAANQRKPAAIHDTHGQYNKMPKYGPQELSRMKAEKDARENREQLLMQQRQQEQFAAARRMQMQQQQQQQPQNAAQPGAQPPATPTPNGTLRAGNPIPATQVPQIRNQANIISRHQQQLASLANQVAMANAAHAARFGPNPPLIQVPPSAQARAMIASVQAQAQAQAQAAQAQVQGQVPQQGQGHVGSTSLAAGAAPALQAHLSPPYNAARAASSSPGIAQQSPPHQQAMQNPATSPRPPSAQAQVVAGQVPAAAAVARAAPALAHYYGGAGVPGAGGNPQLTQEQLRQMIMQQNAIHVMQQQQAQQHQQNGTYSVQ